MKPLTCWRLLATSAPSVTIMASSCLEAGICGPLHKPSVLSVGLTVFDLMCHLPWANYNDIDIILALLSSHSNVHTSSFCPTCGQCTSSSFYPYFWPNDMIRPTQKDHCWKENTLGKNGLLFVTWYISESIGDSCLPNPATIHQPKPHSSLLRGGTRYLNLIAGSPHLRNFAGIIIDWLVRVARLILGLSVFFNDLRHQTIKLWTLRTLPPGMLLRWGEIFSFGTIHGRRC